MRPSFSVRWFACSAPPVAPGESILISPGDGRAYGFGEYEIGAPNAKREAGLLASNRDHWIDFRRARSGYQACHQGRSGQE